MATYTKTYGSGNDTIAPPDGYSLYVIDGGAGTDTVYADARSTGFTFSAPDAAGVITVSGASGTVLKLTNVEKVAFKDGVVKTLATGSSVNNITGTAANDTLTGTSGNDAIDGGAGIDTLQLAGLASGSVSLSKTATGWTLSGSTIGTDTLTNVERLSFADKKIALDVSTSGKAGEALMAIGTVAPFMKNDMTSLGAVINLADQMDLKSIFQLALDAGLVAQLSGGGSNLDVARMAFRNIIGSEADTTTANNLAGMMDGGMAQVDFLVLAASYVSLTGVQTTGVSYL